MDLLVGASRDGNAKLDRAIRINAAAGIALLGGSILAVLLVVTGIVDWASGLAPTLGIGFVIGAQGLLTAWALRKDRDDPAGIERRRGRPVAATVVWGAVLLLAVIAVAVIIAWGLLR